MSHKLKLLGILLFFGSNQFAVGQSPRTVQLKRELMAATTDTTRVLLMSHISASYRFSRHDSSLWYGHQGLALARKIKFKKGEGRCLQNISRILAEKGNTPLALQMNLQALQLNKETGDWYGEMNTVNSMVLMFLVLENYEKAHLYYFQGMKLYHDRKIDDNYIWIVLSINQGLTHIRQNHLDSAEFYINRTYDRLKKSTPLRIDSRGNPADFVIREVGYLNQRRGHPAEAMRFYRQAVKEAIAENDVRSLSITYQFISDWFRTNHQNDSATVYARKAVVSASSLPLPYTMIIASGSLADLYTLQGNKDSVIKYMALRSAAKDSLFNPERIRRLETLNFTEQQRLRQIEQGHEEFNNKVKVYGLLISVGVLLLGSFVLGRSNRRQKKANEELKTAHEELKATQSQLIQSEKMASLGELTAGIAHEIQNPLNFVNNFSEVNTELIDELEQEVEKGNFNEVRIIARDIRDNEEKITHHGKRADAIVKGMLQHSRSSSGVKEPTDINALADEYLRLAYHGLRAKDKSFNATMKTDFDKTIGSINIIPQDIGRVVLNLITNAFYAVTEKAKTATTYEPTVTVSTEKKGNKVLVKVKDNGNGIPQNVIDKIFQPFFTTKPTGQGTGLGLSLSYDIVKAHGGEIKVETNPGNGSEFIILLPAI